MNKDKQVVDDFGLEWAKFTNSQQTPSIKRAFQQYFSVFPLDALSENSVGFDMGCGSGRWAHHFARTVSAIHCIDPSDSALAVAKHNLSDYANCHFHHAAANEVDLPDNSMDFGYSLGVLHHVPDTLSGLKACARLLKPGAPFLLYLYYRFDNKPLWFRLIWKGSDLLRKLISHLPFRVKAMISDLIALLIYWPLARLSASLARCGIEVDNIPLSAYRDYDLTIMRNDALDRFSTRLEKRFTREEIKHLMESAGFERVVFSKGHPYWVACGIKR